MADPTPYDRQYSFRQWQAQHPADPLPGDRVDSEFDAVKASLDETQANLELIQRSDGQLGNATVGLDQLKPDVLAGVSPAVMWAASTAIALDAIVFYGVLLYRCIAAHTSTSTFDASKFVLLADFTSIAIPPGSIGTSQLLDGAVTAPKLADGAVAPAKLGSFPGSSLWGRYSASTGGFQAIALGTGLSFVGNTLTATLALADGDVTTPKLAANAVTNAKLAVGAAVANIGYTPVNQAGDTGIGGVLQRNGQGAHLWHGGSYTSGKITLSTSDPSGGADGDLWFKYTP
jgi:hypothetical protein